MLESTYEIVFLGKTYELGREEIERHAKDYQRNKLTDKESNSFAEACNSHAVDMGWL
jgi:hypothetical protein